ncbi:MAG: hypothetical protein ABI638_10495 [Ignavibacteriota bacterium]
MKKYILYILIGIAVVYSGCDKPSPTELINDPHVSENLDLEIITKDINNEFYSNGFDTSGITVDIRNYASIISVSGIKLTRNGRTDNISSALTFLFDKSKPFKYNGTILGYNTITPGIIKFNDVTARLTNYRVRYREGGVFIDTVLGKKYELFNINGSLFNDQFTFPYNSSIAFFYNPFIGQSMSFDISTPYEITGNVQFVKTQNQNNFNAELNWDAGNTNKFSIIIGGIRTSNEQNFPFFRIKTRDDGHIVIPNSILKNIPRNIFGKISFTFIRKFDKLTNLQNTDLYVVSQSIHTIIVEIP